MSFEITGVAALEILDSRGRPTLQTTITLADGTTAVAGVPSGASTGTREAVELRDGDTARFGGSGVLTADGRSLTAATSIAILLYAAHNGAATFASLGGGHLADRFSPRGVFAAGAAVYVLGYVVFAWEQHQWPILLIGFVLCGLGIGFAETAESTVVAHLLPEHLRSNGFGVLGLVQSFGDLGATMVTGILWSVFSATVAFLYAATWMILSVAASGWLRPPRQRAGDVIS